MHLRRNALLQLLLPGVPALVLSLLPIPAAAQWSSSPTVNKPIATESSVAGNAVAVSDLAGGAILAWGRGSGMSVQRIDAFGYTQWAAGGKLLNNTNTMYGPRALSDGAGGVWCAWHESSALRQGVFVQRVDGSGTELLGAPDLNLTPIGGCNAICTDNANGVIVGWRQDRTTSGNTDSLYLRRVGAAGDTTNWGPYGVLYQAGPRLKAVDLLQSSTDNGCIVGWHIVPNVNISDPDTFFFQRFSATGAPQWPSPGAPSPLRLVTLDDTGIELACVGASGSVFFTTMRGDSLYLHRLASTGTFASPVVGWPVGGLPASRPRSGLAKSMIPDGEGGVVVAWRDESYTAPTGRIRAQRFNASGVGQWPVSGGTFVEVCAASNDQSFPRLVQEGRGDFVVSWEDYRNTVHVDLYAQKLLATTGAAQWPASGLKYAGAGDAQSGAALVAANPGHVISAFQDARTGSSRLYAQFIGDPGVLVPVNTLTFTTVQNLPEPHAAAGYATDGASLFVEGGGPTPSGIHPNLLRFDPGTGWTTLGTGYVPRAFGSLAYDPGTARLYAFNGHNFATYQSSVEAISLTGGAATLMTPSPLPSEGAGVAAVGGRIYSLSGANDVITGGRHALVRSYDPAANTWSTAHASLIPARTLHAAAPWGGRIYSVGGTGSAGRLRRVDAYDIAMNAWSPQPDAPMPIDGHAVATTGSLLWYLGDSGNGLALMSFNPPSGAWTLYATNMVARRHASAAGLGTNLVVTGGVNGSPSRDVVITQMVDVAAAVAAAPTAAVTVPVTGPGAFLFAETGESTGVSLDFSSVGGAGTASVARYPGPAANISFSGGAPADTGTTRWVITQSGVAPFSAELRIDLDGLADGLNPGMGITLYHRPTPGSGPFEALPTTYDLATNSAAAIVTGFSEFILGTWSPVSAPGARVADRLALAPSGANPARGPLSFAVWIPAGGAARLDLFDLQGRRVGGRDLTALGAGRHVVAVEEDRALPAGIYLARLTQGAQTVRLRVARIL